MERILEYTSTQVLHTGSCALFYWHTENVLEYRHRKNCTWKVYLSTLARKFCTQAPHKLHMERILEYTSTQYLHTGSCALIVLAHRGLHTGYFIKTILHSTQTLSIAHSKHAWVLAHRELKIENVLEYNQIDCCTKDNCAQDTSLSKSTEDYTPKTQLSTREKK